MYYLNNTHGNLPIASPSCISYCKIKFVVLSVLVLPQDKDKVKKYMTDLTLNIK